MILISGWINFYKDVGRTSLSCVKQVKRVLDVKKAGHFGTLDPAASGVLPIAVGAATKVIPFIRNLDKRYSFNVFWGEERSTDDAEGEVLSYSRLIPSKDEIEKILGDFTGNISQVPPIFSAVNVSGKRSYDLARSGVDVKLQPKVVCVKNIQITEHDQNAGRTSFIIDCGSGTYVRSIARDMGKQLKCFGYASDIKRLSNGFFDISDAVDARSITRDSLLGIDYPIQELELLQLSEEDTEIIKARGNLSLNHILFINKNYDSYYRASRDGIIFAVCRLYDSGLSAVCIFK